MFHLIDCRQPSHKALQAPASRAFKHQHAGDLTSPRYHACNRVPSSRLDCRLQRSAFASVDTLTAQIEVETGLRVRLRQQRVMRAAKFIMLMYTLRTAYTVLILTGFSLKHPAQIDLQSPCRHALFMLHTTSWFLTCRCILNPAILQIKPTNGS